MATANKVLSIAAKEVGYSRWDDPKNGTKYGRWYAKKTGSSYFGTNGVPYCAMFVAWVLAQAGQKCSGMPTASCTTFLNGVRKAGLVRSSKKSAKAGDAVIEAAGSGPVEKFDPAAHGHADTHRVLVGRCGVEHCIVQRLQRLAVERRRRLPPNARLGRGARGNRDSIRRS